MAIAQSLVDVTDESQVIDLVASAESAFGVVDVFCANAGIVVPGGVEVPDEVWQRMWAVNVQSHIFAARAVLPAMLKRGEGYLVHTASAAGLLLRAMDVTTFLSRRMGSAIEAPRQVGARVPDRWNSRMSTSKAWKWPKNRVLNSGVSRNVPFAQPIRPSWMGDNRLSACSARSPAPRPRRKPRSLCRASRSSANSAFPANTGTRGSCRPSRPPSLVSSLNIGPAVGPWRRDGIEYLLEQPALDHHLGYLERDRPPRTDDHVPDSRTG